MSSTSRRPKRTNIACDTCRKKKIKCSGSIPCPSCIQRGVECKLETDSRKVVVSQRYLRELQRTAAHQEAEEASEAADTIPVAIKDQESQLYQSEPESNLTNPLASATSTYLTCNDGRQRSLGQSSTWSFTQRTLIFIRDHLNHPESPEISTNEESIAYALTWGSQGFDEPSNFSDLPSIDHALYLANAAKFHVGQLFHLLDDQEFMRHLHEFYENPAKKAKSSRIWFVQFLAVTSLGKLCVASSRPGARSPPGSDLFIRAMSLLPDPSYLFNDPLTAIETLCTISLYLQSVDMRNSAFIYIGQALRMSLLFGIHLERPSKDWDPRVVERCQKVWWTVYILDRTFTSSQGVPLSSIQDHDITTPLPKTQVSREGTAIHVHVKLARVTTEVVNRVYGANNRLGANFLLSIQLVLRDIASIAGDLNGLFPLSFDGSVGGISRVAAHLHLYYHQAILLALYPLIYCLFEKKIKEPADSNREPRNLSVTSKALVKTCTESCHKMLQIVGVLHEQSLLESSLPFDLERTFSASFVLVMISVIIPSSPVDNNQHNKSHVFLEEMVRRGSIPAEFRKSELELLEFLVGLWNSQLSSTLAQESTPAQDTQPQQPVAQSIELPPDVSLPFNDISIANLLSPGQLLDVVKMVDASHVDVVQGNEWLDSWIWEGMPMLPDDRDCQGRQGDSGSPNTL